MYQSSSAFYPSLNLPLFIYGSMFALLFWMAYLDERLKRMNKEVVESLERAIKALKEKEEKDKKDT